MNLRLSRTILYYLPLRVLSTCNFVIESLLMINAGVEKQKFTIPSEKNNKLQSR